MDKLEKRIDEKLAFYGYDRDYLTKEEMADLVEETKAELEGDQFLDGVLFNVPPFRVKPE